jgi:hypothetical protein
MLYAVLGLTSVRFSVSPAAEWWLGPLIGAQGGPSGGVSGIKCRGIIPPTKLPRA